jgi:hypothetical protein
MANRAITSSLTDTKIKAAKPADKAYTMADGNGLQLLVKPNGSKLWEVRYTVNGKAKRTSIGNYPTISLKDARLKRDDFKQLAANGIDPVQKKNKRNKKSDLKKTGSSTSSSENGPTA